MLCFPLHSPWGSQHFNIFVRSVTGCMLFLLSRRQQNASSPNCCILNLKNKTKKTQLFLLLLNTYSECHKSSTSLSLCHFLPEEYANMRSLVLCQDANLFSSEEWFPNNNNLMWGNPKHFSCLLSFVLSHWPPEKWAPSHISRFHVEILCSLFTP